METLHTIATNFNSLSQIDIDWSTNGGMFWLTGTVVSTLIFMSLLLIRRN